MMSGRPGSIVAEIPVPFAYPRPPDLRYAPEFAALTGRVSHALGGGAETAASDKQRGHGSVPRSQVFRRHA